MTSREEPAILARNLEKRFGDVAAVQDVSFQVRRGSITALLGPNGAGKTTTIKMLLGLVRPSAGRFWIMGKDGNGACPEIRKMLGYVPEDRAFIPSFTVARTISLFRGLSPRWDEKLARRLIDGFNLPPDRRTGSLSRGMASQLALLLALSPRPDILLLDEPASGLDPILRREFMQSILGEVADRGQTVLLSSHNLTEVERVADTVVLMEGGRVALSGSMDRIKSLEKIVRVVFQGQIPDSVSGHPAVLSVRQEGRAHLLVVSGDVGDLLEEINRCRPFAVDVIDQSLEEIFLTHAGRDEQ